MTLKRQYLHLRNLKKLKEDMENAEATGVDDFQAKVVSISAMKGITEIET